MKFSKRILSLFLSLLMVVASIPVFAVTVSANTVKHAESPFCVYYNSNYYSGQNEYMGDYDGTQTDPSKGYTLTYTVHGTDAGAFFLGRDLSVEGGNNRRYFWLWPDGNFYFNYEVNGTYTIIDAPGSWKYKVNDGNYSQLVIQVVPNGDYDTLVFYQNGALVSTLDMNTASEAGGTNGVKHTGLSVRDYLATNGIEFRANPNSIYGWYQGGAIEYGDVAVFNDVLTPSEINAYFDIYDKDYSSVGNTLDALKTVMNEYEGIMKDSSITKTNLLDAYNAYIEASKIYDTVYYGKNNLDAETIKNAVYNLTVAIDLMTEVPTATGNSIVRQEFVSAGNFSNNTQKLIEAKGVIYNNVLYAPEISFNNPFYKQNDAGLDRYLYFTSNPVLLYDGINTPKLPASIRGERNGTREERYYWFVGPVTDTDNTKNADWELVNNLWKGSSGDPDWCWTFQYHGNNELTTTYNYNDTSLRAQTQITTSQYWANVLQLTDTPTKVGNTYNVRWAFGAGGTGADNITYTTTPIRVINYKALTDAISSKIFSYNVGDYTCGGLTELFTAVDNALAIEPQSYFLDGTDSRYDECVSAIESAISTINSITPTPDGDGYQSVRNVLDTEFDETNGLNYTTKSFDDYRKMIEYCRAYMAAVYSGYTYGSVQLQSGYAYNSDMQNLAAAASNVLNLKVDFSELKSLVDAAKELDIFDENGVQTKTFESWLTLQNKISETQTQGEYFINNVGQHGVDKGVTIDCTVGSITYDRINLDLESTAFAFNNENLAYYRNSNNLLEDVPQEQMEAFDAAYEVGSTVPETVYKADVREQQITAMNDARAVVYRSAEYAKNSGYTFPEGVDDKQELVYLSDGDKVDDQTTAVLTAITTLDESKAEFTVIVNDVADEKTYKYGDPYTLEGQSTNGEWKIKYGDNKTINICVDANTPVELIVEDNIDATFTSKVTDATTSYAVYIYDGYGKLVEIRYENEEVTEDYPTNNNLTAATVPFYTFTGWKFETETTEDSKTIYKFTPQYTAQDDGTVLIQQEGKDVKRASFDTAVTLTSDGTNYGWVNKIETETGTVKYQIVSYSTDKFKSYAISPCNYYPFYKDNDGIYYVMDGESKVTLTDQNVDGNILPEGQNVGATANDHLKFKLDNQYPFVYTEKAVVVENATPDSKGRYRVYARFTDGADKYESFGVRVIVGDGKLDGKFTCNGKATSNQYAFTLNLTQNQVTGVDNITFKPYVNHYFKYSEKPVDAFYTSEIVLNISEQGGV